MEPKKLYAPAWSRLRDIAEWILDNEPQAIANDDILREVFERVDERCAVVESTWMREALHAVRLERANADRARGNV